MWLLIGVYKLTMSFFKLCRFLKNLFNIGNFFYLYCMSWNELMIWGELLLYI